MIHFIDFTTNKIVGVISNSNTDMYWDDVHSEMSKDNAATFDFKMAADCEESEHAVKRNRVVIQDDDQHFREFVIEETRTSAITLTKEVYAIGSHSELTKQKIIDPVTLQGQTVETVVDYILQGTAWERGTTEFKGARKIVFESHMTPTAALSHVASEFDLELNFRVEIKGSRVVKRVVDVVERVGEDRGKEFTLGKDLIGVTRIENTGDIVTAMVGLGPEQEDGSRLIVRVRDDDALARWGGSDNRHLWEIYEPTTEDQDMSLERLTQLTKAALEKKINTIVSYEVTAAALEKIFGLSH
ncbi:MAG: phage tail spike protein, partial [Candidatus Fimimonas sp.]